MRASRQSPMPWRRTVMDQVTRAGRCTSNFPSKPDASRSMKRRMRMRVCCSGTDCRSQTTRRSESTMSDEDTECNVHPGEWSHAFCDCRHKGDHPVNGVHECTCGSKWYDDGSEVW